MQHSSNSKIKRHERILGRAVLIFQAGLTLCCLYVVYRRSKEEGDSLTGDDTFSNGHWLSWLGNIIFSGSEEEEEDDDKDSRHWLSFYREMFGWLLFFPTFATWVWARWKLTEHGSFSVMAVAPPKLVSTGPYALSKHPVYLFGWLYMLSFFMIIESKRGALMLTIVGGIVQTWRAQTEEDTLSKTFGFKYTRYKEDVLAVNFRRGRKIWYAVGFLIFLASLQLAYASGGGDKAAAKWARNADIAAETYRRLIAHKCLTFDRKYEFNYPVDAHEHHNRLLNISARFRGMPPHTGQGYYRERWIENYFVDYFVDKPLESFSGLFPLFVQWTDVDTAEHNANPSKSDKERAAIFRELLVELRPDVMYVTVSQANKGLVPVKLSHPNVLVINAGGEGNVPIPLIKGKLARKVAPSSFLSYKTHLGFVGSLDHDRTRARAMEWIKKAVQAYNRRLATSRLARHGNNIQNGPGQDRRTLKFAVWPSTDNTTLWQGDMSQTLFNLAPRGWGRASFRLAEIVQMGRIPVYIYNDAPWVPYLGTPAGTDRIGYVVKDTKDALEGLVDEIGALVVGGNDTTHNGGVQGLSVMETEVRQRLRQVEEHRFWYTYKGVVKQLELFFHSPLDPEGLGMDGGGYLRCAVVPHEYLAASLDTSLP